MDDLHRYVLGLAILEGDRAARGILADYLEEQGERGLAQWARKSGSGKRPRLEFGIMLLPCEIALDLACEFVVAARPHELWPRVDDYLATFRAWQKRRDRLPSFDMYQAQLAALFPPHSEVPSRFTRAPNWGGPAMQQLYRAQLLQQAAHAFGEANFCVHHFLQCRDEGDGKMLHWQMQANQHVRTVSSSLHQQDQSRIDRQFDLVCERYRTLVHPE